MLRFTSPELKKLVKDSDPTNVALHTVDDFDFFEFSDVDQSVKEDIKFLKENPFILKETILTGWVYEVETGKVGFILQPLMPSNKLTFEFLAGPPRRVTNYVQDSPRLILYRENCCDAKRAREQIQE